MNDVPQVLKLDRGADVADGRTGLVEKSERRRVAVLVGQPRGRVVHTLGL